MADTVLCRRSFRFLPPQLFAGAVQVDDFGHTGILRAAPTADNREHRMSETIELEAADAHRLAAYTAGPANAHHGLVVVQEIFGINHHMRSVCDRFATEGYRVIAPALFDRVRPGIELGYAPEDVARGRALRAEVPETGTLADIEAAAEWLEARRKAIVGYCWGGTIAWWGATRMDRFAAAVGWYGGGVAAGARRGAALPGATAFRRNGRLNSDARRGGDPRGASRHADLCVSGRRAWVRLRRAGQL